MGSVGNIGTAKSQVKIGMRNFWGSEGGLLQVGAWVSIVSGGFQKWRLLLPPLAAQRELNFIHFTTNVYLNTMNTLEGENYGLIFFLK